MISNKMELEKQKEEMKCDGMRYDEMRLEIRWDVR